MRNQSKGLLSKGFFASKLFDSKIKTRTVTTKEKVLGHVIGPLGLIFVVNTVAALVERFFTMQTAIMYGENSPMTAIMGERYALVMTIAKFGAVGFGLLNSWLISRTKSPHGRLRPWYLIFGFISIIISGMIFLFAGPDATESYWYYFFTLLICYYTVGSTYFFLFKDNIVSLVTRNPNEKTQLAFLRKMSWTLISGIIIGMIIGSVLMPFWLSYDINGYPILMIGMSIVAIPLLLMEYYYTKERIIDDISDNPSIKNENKIPLKEQMRALFTNKYYVILMVLALLHGLVDNYKGGNVQYFYIDHILGGAENGFMHMIYQIITGTPQGFGAILAYPIAKKVGIKNMTIGGYVLVLIGSVLGWLFPYQMVPAMAAGLLRNIGMIPNAYIFAALMLFAFDSIEHKTGYRLEGLMGVGIITALMSLIYAPVTGGYEAGILKLGFVDMKGVVPSEAVKNFMIMSFYLFDIILAIAYIVLLPFVNIEKKLPQINKDLKERKKQAVIASGAEWIDPEELNRIEREEAIKETEIDRIRDLKELCIKKNLDFETENNKYLKKKEEKEAKKAARQARKAKN